MFYVFQDKHDYVIITTKLDNKTHQKVCFILIFSNINIEKLIWNSNLKEILPVRKEHDTVEGEFCANCSKHMDKREVIYASKMTLKT